jgi:hypothetical protein
MIDPGASALGVGRGRKGRVARRRHVAHGKTQETLLEGRQRELRMIRASSRPARQITKCDPPQPVPVGADREERFALLEEVKPLVLRDKIGQFNKPASQTRRPRRAARAQLVDANGHLARNNHDPSPGRVRIDLACVPATVESFEPIT